MDRRYEEVTYRWEHVSKSIFDRPPLSQHPHR